MSDLSLPRSGYSNRRSPAALAAAIGLNGGAVILLVALPMTFTRLGHTGPLQTYNIRWTPPPTVDDPPPPPPETKQQPTRQAVARPVQKNEPALVEPIVAFGDVRQAVLPAYPPLDAGGGAILPPADPPHEAVLVKARPDPRFAATFRPDYPPALRREGLEGQVTVRITIDERGRVIAVEQVGATHPAFFEETRRQALRAWRFRPATRDGVPVRSEQTLTVQFRMED